MSSTELTGDGRAAGKVDPHVSEISDPYSSSLSSETQGVREERLNLERKVRDTLLFKRAAEVLEVYRNPEAMETLTRIAIIATQKIMAIESSLELSSEELQEIENEIKSSLQDPVYLTTLSAQEASKELETNKEFEDRFEREITEKIREIETIIPKEAISQFEVAKSMFQDYRDTSQKMISLLTDIAEKEGIEVATSKESVRSITKNIFPTVESYKDFYGQKLNLATEYIEKLSKAFSFCSEEGKEVGKKMVELTRITIEQAAELFKDDMTRRVQDIYGE